MRKLLAAVVAFLFLVIVLAVVLQGPAAPPPSAWLVLPDGSSNRIVAVTYGTNHIIGSPFGRMLARLPDSVQDELPVLAHRTTTAQPTLVVWVERRATLGAPAPALGGGAYELLSDGSGFVSGPQNSVVGGFGNMDIGPAAFEVFPRRDPKITLNFFCRSAAGQATNSGSLQFPNPLFHAYPEWQPDSLPATQRAGDVEVTLLRVNTGYDFNSRNVYHADHRFETIRGTNRPGGENITAVDARIRNLAGSNQTWRVVSVQASDASGNDLHSSGMSWDGNDGDNFTFQPVLWPSEKAWKLKLEIKQTAGFSSEKMFTFKNVPLGALDTLNPVGWTTNFAGVTVCLESFLRRPPNTNMSWSSSQVSAVKLANSPLPAGMQLDLLTTVFDQGTTNGVVGSQSSDNERTYSFRQIPLDAKTADFTFAVHQSRFVEFTVRPELPPPATNSAGR